MDSEIIELLKEIKSAIYGVIIAQLVSTIAIVAFLRFIYDKLGG